MSDQERLSVRQISKTLAGRPVLVEVSFGVRPGEKVGLIGANGSGKTTLLRCLTGYWSADSGEIKVNGMPISLNQVFPRSRIGYLAESVPLYLDLTVKEHLKMAAGLSCPALIYSEDQWQEIAFRFGLSQVMHRYIRLLSKGFRQRVGLAIAMLATPDLLILDEPTSSLDPIQIESMYNLIDTLNSDQSLIISSHQLEAVHRICERIIILRDGQIVLDAPSDEVDQAVALSRMMSQ